MLYLERLIAAVTQHPEFTLPYWDYTTPANAALPVQFRQGSSVQWQSLFQANRNVQGGSFANVNGGERIDLHAPGTLTLDALKLKSFDAFNQSLDQNLHGNVHVLTGNGTNMGTVAYAANDPVFWVHHANIDRMWYAWSARGGTGTPAPGAAFTFTRADGTGVAVPLKTVATNDMLDYTYDALPGPARTPVPIQRPASPSRPVTLLSSAPADGLPSAESGPLRLGAAPQVVPLRAVAGAPSVASAVAGRGGKARLRLIVRGVSAAAPPQTLYGVWLNLPSGIAPTSPQAARYRIGTLNFFDAVAMPGMAGMGRDYEFDLTDAVRNPTAVSSGAVTIAPFGPPAEGSAPTISGTLDVVSD